MIFSWSFLFSWDHKWLWLLVNSHSAKRRPALHGDALEGRASSGEAPEPQPVRMLAAVVEHWRRTGSKAWQPRAGSNQTSDKLPEISFTWWPMPLRRISSSPVWRTGLSLTMAAAVDLRHRWREAMAIGLCRQGEQLEGFTGSRFPRRLLSSPEQRWAASFRAEIGKDASV